MINRKANYTYVLWDFNGTIIDDVDTCVKAINETLSAHNMPEIGSLEEYRDHFRFPVIEYYKHVGFRFPPDDFQAISHEWLARYLKYAPESGIRAGCAELIGTIYDTGIKQDVISASETAMLRRMLGELGVSGYFNEICGIDNIYAAGKTGIALEWRSRHPEEKALFIGDTAHDCEVARAIGADCVLISGGHHTDSTLKQTGAFFAATFKEIEELIYGENNDI